jgi:phage shock protein A
MPSHMNDRRYLSDADIAEFKKHIGDIFREELGALHAKVDALHAKVDALHAKVDALHAKVDALSAKFDTPKDAPKPAEQA